MTSQGRPSPKTTRDRARRPLGGFLAALLLVIFAWAAPASAQSPPTNRDIHPSGLDQAR